MTQPMTNGSIDRTRITLGTLMGVLAITLAVVIASDASDTLRYGVGGVLVVGIVMVALRLGAAIGFSARRHSDDSAA